MRASGIALLLSVGCATHSTAESVVDANAPADAAAIDAGPADAAPPPIQVLVGVDRAGAFSTTEAHALKTAYDVAWTGVYIGGACSAGSGWSKTVVTALNANEGWLFMPIWVGQEGPSICGRDTLTKAQGTTDGEATVAMMATYGWGANLDIPVVLDLESGTYTYSASGSQAYAAAWRDAVRAGGYLAYLYSSPTAINAFFDAGVTFDGAWPASWLYTAYKNVTPTDLTQLGTRYESQNRAWQYAGDVTVTGAGQVDPDVSDLLLAPAPGGTNK